MGNEENKLKKQLLFYEEQLLENTTRNDPNQIKELFSEEFIEFTSSGKQYFYSIGDTFGNTSGKIVIEHNSVIIKQLCSNTILFLYVATKADKDKLIRSNRSSIWKKIDGKWKIIFHQGTNCNSE